MAKKATLEAVGTPFEVNGGTIHNYKLRFPDVAFKVVRFKPDFAWAEETLTRIESPEGGILFNSKKHRAHGELVFLVVEDGEWIIYRLARGLRKGQLDRLWQVTEKGVFYPGPEKAVSSKRALAKRLGAECQLTEKEEALLLQLRQKKAMEKAAQEAEKAAKLAAKKCRKEALRARQNLKRFMTASGTEWSGFVVRDEKEATMLNNGDRAVFLDQSGKVIRVLWVKKSPGGQVHFDEVRLPSVSFRDTPDLLKDQSKDGKERLSLRKFSTFRRPKGKRKEGEADTVAYFATREQFTQLRQRRPDKPITVSVKDGDNFHIYRVCQDKVDDLGLMEKVNLERKTLPAKAPRRRSPQYGGDRYLSI